LSLIIGFLMIMTRLKPALLLLCVNDAKQLSCISWTIIGVTQSNDVILAVLTAKTFTSMSIFCISSFMLIC